MRDHLLLFVNGRAVRVGADEMFLTLSDFLRRRRGLTGTKVVCAEGDCGSCTVLLGRVVDRGQLIDYSAVTSCIQLMCQLDAAHVVTVEGLTPWDGRASTRGLGVSPEHFRGAAPAEALGRDAQATSTLNPIQQAMVTCHGTQCGFCTPGFVVSLYDVMRDGRPRGAEAVRRGLVGNLCRCTGYDSIVRAALETDASQLKPVDALYPSAVLLDTLAPAAAEAVLVGAPPRRFYKPVTIGQAVRFKAENPAAVIVAGGTDVGVQVNKRLRTMQVAMSTSALAELRAIARDGDMLRVGAGATLSALERAANEHLPELGRFLAWFGSPLIKNAGTLAGNLATGSPIGDTIPALHVLEAEVEVAGLAATRRMAIARFYSGYRQTVLAPDEIITAIRIPIPHGDDIFRLYKVSRRKDLDIASFGAAIWMRRAGDGATIADVRIAYGGVGPMVLRMVKTEAILRGQAATLDLFERAAAVARDEVTPITDVRGSETYRRTLARNVLLKFWHEAISPAAGDGGGNGRTAGPPVVPAPSAARLPATVARSPGGAS
jgi:xanthine dehydrogenase small subunit